MNRLAWFGMLLGLPVASAVVVTPRRGADLTSRAYQHVWQSDLGIRAFDVTALKPGGPVTARVTVSADSDAARAVQLEIMLPVGAGVLHLADGCRASASPVASLSARVTCVLGDLPVRGLRDVSITTTAVASRGRGRFAVFAFSDTPDPVPVNNFAERVAP